MNYIHPDYQTTPILNFVEYLIDVYDYSKFSDLSESDLNEFVALLNQADGRSDELNCITESPHLDQTMFAFRKMLNDEPNGNKLFIETIKSNAISYYSQIMKNIFDNVLDDKRNSWMSADFNNYDDSSSYKESYSIEGRI